MYFNDKCIFNSGWLFLSFKKWQLSAAGHLWLKHWGRVVPGGPVVKNPPSRASLVAQWLRVCLLMQGTRVRALVREDPTCRGVTGPVSHNY